MFSLFKAIFAKKEFTTKSPATLLAEKVALAMIRKGLSPHSSAIKDLALHLNPIVQEWMAENGIQPDIASKMVGQPLSEFMAFHVPAVLAHQTLSPWWQDKRHAMQLMEKAINEILVTENIQLSS